MNYKFKHLEKHHRVELSEKIYRTTKNYNPIGDLVELIDKIIDVYISSNMRTTEPETPKYTAQDMEDFAEWIDNHHTVQLKTGKQLREMWLKGQSTEEVVKVIATYEFMRGAEEIKYKNKGES